jgi:Protein of unknown function (DUF1549)/Protein of unknown function (DUF1553)
MQPLRITQLAVLTGLMACFLAAAAFSAEAEQPKGKGKGKGAKRAKAAAKAAAAGAAKNASPSSTPNATTETTPALPPKGPAETDPKAATRRAKARRKGAPSETARGTSPEPSGAKAKPVPHLPRPAANAEDALTVASRVHKELSQAGITPAPQSSDEDFLRRVSLDIAGISPTSADISLFGLDADSQKRETAINDLLASEAYATNWARYWRDVIFMRATETRARLAVPPFETWMADKLKSNISWDSIAAELITATGDVSEAGQTALIFAQRAEPDEVAAETARIFLGIQIECANCHDHPTDRWTRNQFHALAAFFPRIQLRPNRDMMMRSFEVVSFNEGEQPNRRDQLIELLQNPEQALRKLDRDADGSLTREELGRGPAARPFIGRLFEQADGDKNDRLSLEELRKLPVPMMNPRRGSSEYYMPDLNDPQSRGTKFDPAFFLGDLKPGEGLTDLDRRASLSRYLTDPDNPWFAKAFVNRIWTQLVGEGFYPHVDDIGPERTARFSSAFDLLSAGFVASGYDIKWLIRTIANTQAYQRSIRPRDPKLDAQGFASPSPVRLRADHLYDALTRVLGIVELGVPPPDRPDGMPRPFEASPRGQFLQLFGFDPSASHEDISGTLPQALFLMNAPLVNNLIRARGNTRLAALLEKLPDNDDAAKELYLIVHAREPTANELAVCQAYLREVGDRREAFEDILWSLLNSTEFQSKR